MIAPEQLRFFLIIGILMTGFLLYQAWQVDYAVKRPAALDVAGTVLPDDGLPSRPSAESSDEVPVIPDTAVVPYSQAVVPNSKRIRVLTDVYDLWFDPVGGGLVQAELLDYSIATDQPDTPIRLLNEYGKDMFILQSGLLSQKSSNNTIAPNHKQLFTVERGEYVLGPGDDSLEVPFVWQSEDGVVVTKTYRFTRDSYLIGLTTHIDNGSAQPWSGHFYGQFRRSEPSSSGGLFTGYTYTGGVLSTQEKPYKKIDFDDLRQRRLEQETKGGWVAMIQHYFAVAWIPPSDAINHYYSKFLNNGLYHLGVLTTPLQVAAGSQAEVTVSIYLGPKLQSRLSVAAPNLERTVDYGFLFFISEPLFWLLSKIYHFIGNWGWAIVLLTLLIKLLFFHLSATSYKSMARMRKLQPRIVALRELYLNDKTRLNQAIMQLYKDEKVNPLGGCLPILIQIPVFISLYWVLLESIEIRQANFIFWYDDLSTHDPYFVLPILMGLSMLIQQKLNPAPPDPMQAKIMAALPFIFTFFFLFFPAGLVLYWVVNNLLSILQQWYITQKIVGK